LLAAQEHELVPAQVPEAEVPLMVPTQASPLLSLKLRLLPDTLPENAPDEQAILMEQPCCTTTQVPAEQDPDVGHVPAMLEQLSPPQELVANSIMDKIKAASTGLMVFSLAGSL
jgi:hypothetical protein